MAEFNLTAQIAEVERELTMRRKVYPHFVASEKLTHDEAKYYMGRMEAVLKTLKWLQANEARIKEKTRPDESGRAVESATSSSETLGT